MSPKRDKTVLQLVEKYRRAYPSFERPILRKLIRLENKEIFQSDSNLKKLDRCLRRAFGTKTGKLLNEDLESLRLYIEPGLITKEDLTNQQIIDLLSSLYPELAQEDPEIFKILNMLSAEGKLKTLRKLLFKESPLS